jgi:hypothetical protein
LILRATLIATKQFDARIGKLLSEDERGQLEFALACAPEGHPTIPGTGGVRKMRWHRAGMGKRGGIRVIYYYITRAGSVGLITAYAKSAKENISDDEAKAIRRIAQWFEETTQ